MFFSCWCAQGWLLYVLHTVVCEKGLEGKCSRVTIRAWIFNWCRWGNSSSLLTYLTFYTCGCYVTYLGEDITARCLCVYLLLVHMLLWYSAVPHVHVLHIYKGDALWWTIYRKLIGHMSATYNWLLKYTISTMADAYAYAHIFIIIITQNIFILTNKIRTNNLHAVSAYEYGLHYMCDTIKSMYVMLYLIAYTVYYCYCPFSSSTWIDAYYIHYYQGLLPYYFILFAMLALFIISHHFISL